MGTWDTRLTNFQNTVNNDVSQNWYIANYYLEIIQTIPHSFKHSTSH